MKLISTSLVALLLSSLAFAKTEIPADMQIASFEVTESPVTAADLANMPVMLKDTGLGSIIAIAKDIVALGEVLYPLIKRGQPEVTTAFAPINVLPINPATGRNVDPFQMENDSRPLAKKFTGVVKNGFGVQVVTMEFLVYFSAGSSFNGKGKYIQNAMVVPSMIHVTWGWDVTATMKLLSISNQGTRSQPVAGAVMQMNYTVKNLITHLEKNHLIDINGNGQLSVQ